MTTPVQQHVIAEVQKTNSTGAIVPPVAGAVPTADGAGNATWVLGGSGVSIASLGGASLVVDGAGPAMTLRGIEGAGGVEVATDADTVNLRATEVALYNNVASTGSVDGGEAAASVLGGVSLGSLVITPAQQAVGQIFRIQTSYLAAITDGTTVTFFLMVDGSPLLTLPITVTGLPNGVGMVNFRVALDGTTAQATGSAVMPGVTAGTFAGPPWDPSVSHTFGLEAVWNGGAANTNLLFVYGTSIESLIPIAAVP